MKSLLYTIVLSSLFLLTGCNEKLNVQQKIAKHYGIDQFHQVESIQYTWNVQSKHGAASRTWTYNPNTKDVHYQNGEIKKTWNRDKIPEDLKKLDGDFINDQYWVLFPFHLLWDPGVTFVTGLKKKAPISGKEYHWLRIAYPKGLGYTPGDAYELYFDDQHNIHEWTYHGGGKKEIDLKSTWEKPVNVSGFLFASEFNNNEGFKLWISDIKIKLKKKKD
ncbi:hypothetical protein MJH12_12665 [bacterium]|nr:hypothetical protein [bacterium]